MEHLDQLIDFGVHLNAQNFQHEHTICNRIVFCYNNTEDSVQLQRSRENDKAQANGYQEQQGVKTRSNHNRKRPYLFTLLD